MIYHLKTTFNEKQMNYTTFKDVPTQLSKGPIKSSQKSLLTRSFSNLLLSTINKNFIVAISLLLIVFISFLMSITVLSKTDGLISPQLQNLQVTLFQANYTINAQRVDSKHAYKNQ